MQCSRARMSRRGVQRVRAAECAALLSQPAGRARNTNTSGTACPPPPFPPFAPWAQPSAPCVCHMHSASRPEVHMPEHHACSPAVLITLLVPLLLPRRACAMCAVLTGHNSLMRSRPRAQS